MVVQNESLPSWDERNVSDIQNVSANMNLHIDSNGNSLQKCDRFDSEPMIAWKHTFNMRQVTLCNLSGNTLRSMVQRTQNHRIRGRCVVSATKSLDVLRQNLQASINRDIDSVIKGYLEKFFTPAVENIRNNLGNNSVTEDHMKDVCRAMLEEAKNYYSNKMRSRGSSPPSDGESLLEYTLPKHSPRSPLFRKRESDTDSDTHSGWAKRRKVVPISVSLANLDPLRINSKTLFMLAPRAHKVLGLAGVRGRLFVKHPELFRYTADQEDRDWLTSRKLLLSSSTIPTYLIVLDDVKEIVLRDEYKLNPNVILTELNGFQVPEFLLIKIQNFMTELRKLINGTSSPNNFNSIEVGLGVNSNIGSDLSLMTSSMSNSNSTSHVNSLLKNKLSESSANDCLKIQSSNSWDSSTNSSLAEAHSTLTALLSTQPQ